MKKVLIYHLNARDYISDNKCYTIHRECLKHYKNVFDELVFYIAVDDLNNISLINDITNWVSDICYGSIFDIKIRKNTKLCEVQTFKEEIIENKEKYIDSYVYFGHTKNATRLNKSLEPLTDALPNSIITWCLTLYFYGLNFIDELETKFNGLLTPSELFYGPILTQLKNPDSSPMLRMNKGNCFYQGTFYWINMNKFINYLNNKIITLPIIDDRFWVEMLPGVVGGRERWGDGCASHNDTAINDDFNLYKMTKYEWENLIELLGNSNEFWEFHDYIMKKVLEKRDN